MQPLGEWLGDHERELGAPLLEALLEALPPAAGQGAWGNSFDYHEGSASDGSDDGDDDNDDDDDGDAGSGGGSGSDDDVSEDDDGDDGGGGGGSERQRGGAARTQAMLHAARTKALATLAARRPVGS